MHRVSARGLSPQCARMSDGYSDEEFEEDNLVAKPMYSGDNKGQAPLSGTDARVEGRGEYNSDEETLEDDDSEERIEKLRIANAALRKQLKDFSKAFQEALNGKIEDRGGPNQSSATAESAKKSLRALVASKQRQVQGLQKKLEMYRKSNSQLKRQLKQAYTTDRVLDLGNENLRKQAEIDRLVAENRQLQSLQRNQSKRIEQQRVSREEWPARLAGLQDELRVTRETLRKYKEKTRVAEESSGKQRTVILKMQEKNRELKKEIERYENANGKAKTKQALDIEAAQLEWEKDKEKLSKSIQVLEKSNRQERKKAQLAAREAEEKLKDHEKEVAALKERIEEKEKDMRYQVLQIKRLKRGLRELAMADTPRAVAAAIGSNWATNMSKYLSSADAQEDALNSPEVVLDSPKVHAKELAKASPQQLSPAGYVLPSTPKEEAPAERGPRIARTEQDAIAEPSPAGKQAKDAPKHILTDNTADLVQEEKQEAQKEKAEEEVKEEKEEEEDKVKDASDFNEEEKESPRQRTSAFAKPSTKKKKKKKVF